MKVLETERLALRHLREDDAGFMLELVNDPAWIRYIGNKNIATEEDARAYIVRGPMAMYAKLGSASGSWSSRHGRGAGICG